MKEGLQRAYQASYENSIVAWSLHLVLLRSQNLEVNVARSKKTPTTTEAGLLLSASTSPRIVESKAVRQPGGCLN